MKIKKDTLLDVNHSRKGKFLGIATRDFDTESETFYPIALAERKRLYAASVTYSTIDPWVIGDEIPCRNSLCQISQHQEIK